MTKLVKLRRTSGNDFYINPNIVTHIQEGFNEVTRMPYTNIFTTLPDNRYFSVSHDADKVAKLLNLE